MFVVFEGIDGSGKTTLSNRVAAALRQRGLSVAHVREGGKFVSTVTQSIRELGRDARNLMMTPRTELMLFIARDGQLLEEATLPALRESDVVLADRYFYTAEVLARFGRGLPEDEVRPIIAAAARGVEPDLVVLVDVDPHVARARRRVSKILVPDDRPSSRKGLAGVGLQHRMREGYRELAARDAKRWVVVDNTEAPLDEMVSWLVELISARRSDPTATPPGMPANMPAPARGWGSPYHTPLTSPDAALAAFLAWIDRRATREPALAAYFLGGLFGPGVDERRVALATTAPEVVAAGLRGLTDPVSWQLRRELLPRAPGLVARSLAASAGDAEDAWRMRDELALIVPADVAASLDGRDEPAAWALRDRLWTAASDAVVASLKRIGTDAAWLVRERWLSDRGAAAFDSYPLARTICESVNGVSDERAWDIRKKAREAAPVAMLASLGGLLDDKAWKWRERHLEQAPKTVLRTIAGLDDPRAWALREASCERVKEAVDSMAGLDGDAAWRIRERCASIWPSTVAKSLGPLGRSERGAALLRQLLERHPDNPSLLKHAAGVALGTDLANSSDEE